MRTLGLVLALAVAAVIAALRVLMAPDAMERASAHLGESEAATSQGRGAAFAALLSAVVRRSGEPGTMDRLYALIDDPANEPSSVIAAVGRLFSGDAATPGTRRRLQPHDLPGRADASLVVATPAPSSCAVQRASPAPSAAAECFDDHIPIRIHRATG